MPRGFVRAVYVTDLNERFWTYVDADYFTDPGRGWTPLGGSLLTPLPRGWRARFVEGLDAAGNRQTTRVATPTAPLWTGVQPTWFLEPTSGPLVVATRIARHAEKTIR
jgi:hypothetical protein